MSKQKEKRFEKVVEQIYISIVMLTIASLYFWYVLSEEVPLSLKCLLAMVVIVSELYIYGVTDE